jgi:hypothetical protein
MALALVGFIELRMRQSPMNRTNYAEIVAMRCVHGMTLPEWRQCCGDPWRFSRGRLREIASVGVPGDWSPLLGSVNHVDRILDERPLCATSGQSGMALGEIMAHFLITSLEPLVIKAVGEILLAAKERADRGN